MSTKKNVPRHISRLKFGSKEEKWTPEIRTIAIRAAKPRTPLITVAAIIVRGTTVDAFGISSAICQQSANLIDTQRSGM